MLNSIPVGTLGENSASLSQMVSKEQIILAGAVLKSKPEWGSLLFTRSREGSSDFHCWGDGADGQPLCLPINATKNLRTYPQNKYRFCSDGQRGAAHWLGTLEPPNDSVQSALGSLSGLICPRLDTGEAGNAETPMWGA